MCTKYVNVQTTIFGYVGGEIAFSEGGARGDHATFRVGSTPRLYDKNNGGWRDGETIWTTVSCWRALAGNVKSSVHIGDPVVDRQASCQYMDRRKR